MTERNPHYHIRVEKHVFMTAVFTAVLAAGLLLTITQVGQVQTLQQRAQIKDNACPASATKADVERCCAGGPVELNQSNQLSPVWECKGPAAAAAPPAGAPAAPAAKKCTAMPDNACSPGGGLPAISCNVADGYHCKTDLNTCVGGCVKDPTTGTGKDPLTDPNNCTAPGTSKGLVCDVKAGYECKGGFCVRNASGLPQGSSATANGQLGGPSAGSKPGAGGGAGTQPIPGEVCNGQTRLTPEEAVKLSGFCPEADPVPGENLCKNFCTKAENANSDKCKPGGIYHCSSTNGKCGAAGSCQHGVAEGYCSDAEGGTCCTNPPPPPPPPPAPPAAANPAGGAGGAGAKPVAVKPRTPPGAGGAGGGNAVAQCRNTCKAPKKCNSRGVCYNPGTAAAAGDPACRGKAAGTVCGPGKTCRSFGSGGINSPGLYCQTGTQVTSGTGLNKTQVLTGTIANGGACKNGTECTSKNCAPNGAGGWVCK